MRASNMAKPAYLKKRFISEGLSARVATHLFEIVFNYEIGEIR